MASIYEELWGGASFTGVFPTVCRGANRRKWSYGIECYGCIRRM